MYEGLERMTLKKLSSLYKILVVLSVNQPNQPNLRSIYYYSQRQSFRPYSMPSTKALQLASMMFVCALTVVQEA